MKHADLLNKIPLFASIQEGWRYYLAERLQEIHYQDDEYVFRAGEPSTGLYLVSSGAVALFTDTPGEPVELKARIEPGGAFGEVGVLEGSTRSLSARADGPTTILCLDGSDLIAIARAHDDLAQELCQIAIGYSLENRAAKAELARRKEVRIRIGQPVELRTEFDRVTVLVENLSLGGFCLGGLPAHWQLDESTKVSVHLDPATALFRFHGMIAWRKNDRVGICFTRTFADHEFRIARALHRLVGAAKEAEAAAMIA